MKTYMTETPKFIEVTVKTAELKSNNSEYHAPGIAVFSTYAPPYKQTFSTRLLEDFYADAEGSGTILDFADSRFEIEEDYEVMKGLLGVWFVADNEDEE